MRGLLYRARATLRSAAAAITPQPLLAWACGTGTPAPMTERLGELTAGGGAIGLTGTLFKGTAVLVTAGALAGAAATLHSARPAGHRSARAPAAVVASPASRDQPANDRSEPFGSPRAPSRSTAVALHKPTGARRHLGVSIADRSRPIREELVTPASALPLQTGKGFGGGDVSHDEHATSAEEHTGAMGGHGEQRDNAGDGSGTQTSSASDATHDGQTSDGGAASGRQSSGSDGQAPRADGTPQAAATEQSGDHQSGGEPVTPKASHPKATTDPQPQPAPTALMRHGGQATEDAELRRLGSAPLSHRGQADQGRRERGVLGTRATEDTELRRPGHAPLSHEGQAGQGRRERGVLRTRATEDTELRRQGMRP